MTFWIIMNHGGFYIGTLIFSFAFMMLFLMFGVPRLAALCGMVFGLFFVVPLAVDLISALYSSFWLGFFTTAVIISFFTKSGQEFWDKAFVFGVAYRATETLYDKLNDKK